ncbi:TPA: hypothetical protein DIC39_03025 [Patescibacteria group bacterium]|nr:hypothetical protein [Patescibacteria group bacterium]
MGESHQSLAFLTLGINFLNLVENIFSETIKQGNAHFIIGDEFIDEKSYDQKTKWSDFRILPPTLFIFYHALELIMKGLEILENHEPKPTHSLNDLYSKIRINEQIPVAIKNIFGKHIDEKFLSSNDIKNFLDTNALSIDDLYEAFRYPTDKNFNEVYKYLALKYRGRKLLPYIELIIEDSIQLRRETVSFYRSRVNEF